MAPSKSTRIIILLAIDTAFFFLELIVGSAVSSLALIADSFHMLNDVLSLCVGLWAVKVANQKSNSKKYTYGWQRAETLGALVNGVFLVALCITIFVEALQRFVDPPKISNPKLVLSVGSLGLVSNIAGLFLFHDHGHSHGGDNGHGQSKTLADAEEGHSNGGLRDEGYTGGDVHTEAVADEGGNVADVLPQNTIAGWPKTKLIPKHSTRSGSKGFTKSDEDGSTARETASPLSTRLSTTSHTSRRHRRHTSASRSRLANPDDINIHPASFRNEIIAASRLGNIESDSDSEFSGAEEAVEDNEESPLIKHSATKGSASHDHGQPSSTGYSSVHKTHKHAQPKDEEPSGGHSHSDLNMRGVFLHVLGDALGNIGVIGSALFIWLTQYSWRFYADPLISLIITVIILASAIPLCKAASRILLQAVPAGINVDDIKDDINLLPGVISCHHLHVWQLSDTKLIASLHIQLEYDIKGEGSARYMAIARARIVERQAPGVSLKLVYLNVGMNAVMAVSVARRGLLNPGESMKKTENSEMSRSLGSDMYFVYQLLSRGVTMCSKQLDHLSSECTRNEEHQNHNTADCGNDRCCEPFHKSKAEARALVMLLESIDSGRCHLGFKNPLPTPLAEGTTMETLRARHWEFTQEHEASDLYLDIMDIFRDFILKQSSLEVRNLNKHTIRNIYFQEPTFNSLDKAFLKSRGFQIIDSPECIQHMTEQTFLFAPYCDMAIVNACLNKAFPAMLTGRVITNQNRWFFSPEKAPEPWIDPRYALPAVYPAARGLYHSYLEKRAVIRMPFSTMPSPNEARQICEGELYVTCDDPEEYRFRDDFFEFREEELFTRKQANAVWRSKGLTPWDASRWDTFVWFLTVTVDKILPNSLRNLLKQYCPKLSEALPSEIWKTMPPFPEAFDKDYEHKEEGDEEEKKNR
ncbi:zinc/cadmium resistance protein [Physcia stellaris]|nr:zinc/cadmium resistance protein [Physcia stellaris]